MANQQNYTTDIISTANQYTKFTVSRIVDSPMDSLIQIEIPPTIPEKFEVEVSLYSLYDNLLVYTTTIPSTSDVVTLQKLTYADTSARSLLFFDFSKTNIQLVDGRFQAVFSFLTPVIGDASVVPLMVTNISPSRTELQLQLMPEYRTPASASYLRDYMSPQITREWVVDAMRQIFNQPASSTSNNIPTDRTNMSYDIVKSFFPTNISNLLESESTNTQFTSSVEQTTKIILDKAYGYATQSITTLPDSTIYTLNNLNTLVSASVAYGIQNTIPSEYGGRFTII